MRVQFIVGDDNAIITVQITRCRVCDIHDSVVHWTRGAPGELAGGRECPADG